MCSAPLRAVRAVPPRRCRRRSCSRGMCRRRPSPWSRWLRRGATLCVHTSFSGALCSRASGGDAPAPAITSNGCSPGRPIPTQRYGTTKPADDAGRAGRLAPVSLQRGVPASAGRLSWLHFEPPASGGYRCWRTHNLTCSVRGLADLLACPWAERSHWVGCTTSSTSNQGTTWPRPRLARISRFLHLDSASCP